MGGAGQLELSLLPHEVGSKSGCRCLKLCWRTRVPRRRLGGGHSCRQYHRWKLWCRRPLAFVGGGQARFWLNTAQKPD